MTLTRLFLREEILLLGEFLPKITIFQTYLKKPQFFVDLVNCDYNSNSLLPSVKQTLGICYYGCAEIL